MSQALQDETPSSTRASLRFETTASSTASTSSSSSLAAGDTTRHDKKTHRFEAFQARLLPPKRRLLVRGAVLALVTAAEVPLDRDAREARDAAEREREPHLPLAEVDGLRGRRQVLDPQVALALVLLPEEIGRDGRDEEPADGAVGFDWIGFDSIGRGRTNARQRCVFLIGGSRCTFQNKREVDTARKKQVLKKRRATRARGRAGSGQRACR